MTTRLPAAGGLLALSFLLGCGGPTSSRPPENTGPDVAPDSFAVFVENAGFRPGRSTETMISVKRGKEFDAAVELDFEPPQGIRVNPAKVTCPAKRSSRTVNLVVGGRVKPGEHVIKVKATPTGGGAPRDFELKINVANGSSDA